MNGKTEDGGKNNAVFLYFATFVVNLASVAVGATFTWPSPVIPKLRTESNPLGRPISPSEESLLVSLNNVGGICSPIIVGFLADYLGRKKTQLLLMLPIILGHVIMAFIPQIEFYYLARILVGLGAGGFFSLLPLYLAEIAEVKNRGVLGSLMIFFMNLGTFWSYSIGPYVDLEVFSLINLVPALTFFVIFLAFIPESPYYLVSVNKKEEALKALKTFRQNSGPSLRTEFEEIVLNVEELKSKNVHSLKDYVNRPLLKGLFIIMGLILFQQLSAITAVMGYMQTIFEATGTKISPEISTMTIAVIPIVVGLVTSSVVEKAGRRILLLISLTGVVLSLSALALFFQIKEAGYDTTPIFWLPILSLMVYNASFPLGIGSITWSMMGELFRPDVKAKAAMIATSTCFALSSLITMYFPKLLLSFGFAAVFWLFAISSMIGIAFVIFVVPETKGKTFIEIQNMLNK